MDSASDQIFTYSSPSTLDIEAFEWLKAAYLSAVWGTARRSDGSGSATDAGPRHELVLLLQPATKKLLELLQRPFIRKSRGSTSDLTRFSYLKLQSRCL